jgi:GNAT superfamily N-acetyltransferase
VNTAIVSATVDDVASIAALHAASWRSAYRGLLPDTFLDNDVEQDRRDLWEHRFRPGAAQRPLILKAMEPTALAGFACAFLDDDPKWGTLLDNLHVRPDVTSRGIGRMLLAAVLDHVRKNAVKKDLHLWVFAGNHRARRFYEREGGRPNGAAGIEVIPGVRVDEVRYVFDASLR